MSERDELETGVAVVLRTRKKFVLRNLASGSLAERDAAVAEISRRVSDGICGQFDLTRKNWTDVMWKRIEQKPEE